MPHLADLNRDSRQPKQYILDYADYADKQVGDLIEYEGKTLKIVAKDYYDADGVGILAEDATIIDMVIKKEPINSSAKFTMSWEMRFNKKKGRWENYFPDEEEKRERKEIEEKRKHYQIKSTEKRKIFVLEE